MHSGTCRKVFVTEPWQNSVVLPALRLISVTAVFPLESSLIFVLENSSPSWTGQTQRVIKVTKISVSKGNEP